MKKKIESNEALQKREEPQIERVQERPWIAPRVDIYENDHELLLVADLPGVDEKNLKIDLDKDQLTIEGMRQEEDLGKVLGWEYRPLDYHRSFLVPQGINEAKITAELKLGVLKLHLPKAEGLKPRKIEVKVG